MLTTIAALVDEFKLHPQLNLLILRGFAIWFGQSIFFYVLAARLIGSS
jgi:hypothetical protein